MKKKESNPFFLILLFCGFLSSLLLGCSSSKKLNNSNPASYIPFNTLTKDSTVSLLRLNNTIKYIKAKGKAHYIDHNEDVEFGVSLYSVKDSAALIILKKLGVEICRVLLNTNEYHLLDRMNLRYTKGPYKSLPYKLFTTLGLSTIQELLTSGSTCPDALNYELIEEGEFYSLNGSSGEMRIENKLSKVDLKAMQCRFFLPEVYTIIQSQKFYSSLGMSVPMLVQISSKFNAMDTPNYLKIEWNKVEFNPLKDLKFNIPDHYSRK